MPRVVTFETWICRKERGPQYRAVGHTYAASSRVILLKLTDEDGASGIATCLAERSADGPLAFLHDIVAPCVVGRDVYERERIWLDLQRTDRHLGFVPLYLLGPVDVALWDLAAKRAGLPLYRYLGAARDTLPVYYSSQFMDTLDDYVEDVRRAISLGFTAYKVHAADKLEIYQAVRDAAGPDMVLMADPADDWTYERALRFGRFLEKLNYYWLEEPFRDWHLEKYARLASDLDIPIAGTEATYGGAAGVAQAIARRAIDIVRADVSWKPGVTGSLKIAHLAEAFGMNCELHATVMGPMDIANLHVGCAISNTEYFEPLMPETQVQFPMKDPYPIDDRGMIHVPQGAGLGIDIDWDSVDNATHRYQRSTA